MKVIKFFLALMLVGTFATCVTAADKEKKGGALVGTVSEKPADAKEGVVAVLKSKKGDAHNLIATGEVATQIAEFIKKGTKVRVTGEVTPEGVKVTKIEEAPAKAAK
jgi:hypothetical protein